MSRRREKGIGRPEALTPVANIPGIKRRVRAAALMLNEHLKLTQIAEEEGSESSESSERTARATRLLEFVRIIAKDLDDAVPVAVPYMDQIAARAEEERVRKQGSQ